MNRRSLLAGVTAGLLALGLLLGSPAAGHADDELPPIPTVPGLPIPSLPTDLLVPKFLGSPAAAQPIAGTPAPEHPWLSPNGTNSMHNDAYASDTYEVAGPLGRKLKVTSRSYGVRECATIAFDSRGRIVGLCGGLEGFVMMVIDPVTLNAISQLTTSTRDLTSGANPLTDICGGSYFFLHDDVAYPSTVNKSILQIRVRPDGQLVREQRWSLADQVPAGDCLISTMPDWSGRLWFVTQAGRVGTLDRDSGEVRMTRLPEGEQVTNSVSTDETGGLYVVSTHALYRLDADSDGTPAVTWRETYDRGSHQKPGTLSQGSGVTPTLIGKRWVAINDNADPQTHIVVYDRRAGFGGTRRHCQVPVLPPGESTTENSLVAVGNSLIIENNYGYEGPQSTLLGRTTSPGVARVDIRPDGCRLAWTNDTIAPTSVPKASLGNGLVYVYSKPARVGGQPNTLDAWYFTAIDIRTGDTVWSRLMGTGIQWNNHYAAIYLGPDGSAYVATVAGLIRVRDGA